MRFLVAAVLIVDLCVEFGPPVADAQYPSPAYCPPGGSTSALPPPPNFRPPLQTLMFVRLAGPEGMQVTFFRGQGQAVKLDAPVIVGLRPGYTYRIALSNMKKYRGQTFYPTLEVRGSLLLGGNLRPSDWPAGIVFKDEDFNLALATSVLKKVVFLERVEDALPKSSSPENPLEIPVPLSRDPLAEARERGLPLIIVEMGHREENDVNLSNEGIRGTVYLPGDKFLPPPARLPCMPWTCYPIYDPILGPAPWLFYSLPDGGDWGAVAGFDRFGQLRGVDPADTVAEYQDARGNRKLAVSNRVCLCIPRYLIARGEGIFPAAVSNKYSHDIAETLLAQASLRTRRIPQLELQNRFLELARQNNRPSGLDSLYGTQITAKIQEVEVKVRLSTPISVAGNPLPKVEVPEKEEEPLQLCKWPDTCGGVVGAVVNFFIRFTNRGGRPITNVVVTDSLISRFEYVPGSAKTDREASFTTQPNEVGSTIVRWEFPGALNPGESGTVSFQVRIR